MSLTRCGHRARASRAWEVPYPSGVNSRALAALLALASVGLILLGTQIVDQSHGADPSGKLFLASWLESELWVDPWMIGIGLVGLLAAILLLVFGRRTSSQGT